MSRLMNCDHVFDILTRAPFPTGDDSDGDVEHHLRACHECRQLAEALRPAVDLFHESIGGEDSFDLPGYMGTLFEAADAAGTTLVRSQLTTRRQANSGMASTGLGLAICLLVCCGLVVSMGRDWLPSGATTLAAPSETVARPDAVGLELLASLDLPSICRKAFEGDSGQAPVLEVDNKPARTKTRCCTECHAVANPNRPQLASTVKLTNSCNTCHQADSQQRQQAAILRIEGTSVAWLEDVIARLTTSRMVSDQQEKPFRDMLRQSSLTVATSLLSASQWQLADVRWRPVKDWGDLVTADDIASSQLAVSSSVVRSKRIAGPSCMQCDIPRHACRATLPGGPPEGFRRLDQGIRCCARAAQTIS